MIGQASRLTRSNGLDPVEGLDPANGLAPANGPARVDGLTRTNGLAHANGLTRTNWLTRVKARFQRADRARSAVTVAYRPVATLLACVALACPLALPAIAGAGTHSRHARHRDRAHRAGHRHRHARTSHALRATDKAHLHMVSASGPWLYEVGHAAGTLPGGMKVHMRLSTTFSGSFKIHARQGTIVGHGVATPHGSGVWESFGGSLIVTGGTGRYRHAHGRAALYGTFNRRTYALIVNTTGTLHY